MKSTVHLSGLLLALLPLGIHAADPVATQLESLQAADNEDAPTWFTLAQDARAASDLETARTALARAEALGLSPVRVGIESARIDVVAGSNGTALTKLRELVDNGFTAVSIVTGDAVLNSMAGDAGYDALIADLTAKAFPCKDDPRFHEFDFWLGEWEVHDSSGAFAGHNRITAHEAGCVLVEEWSGAGGSTGMSINYFDAAAGKWVQVWNSAGGAQIDIRGGMMDDGMRLVGQIHYVGDGTTAAFRGLWTLLDDGRVRQFFEQSPDDGVSWTPWFEGFYTRVNQNDSTSP